MHAIGRPRLWWLAVGIGYLQREFVILSLHLLFLDGRGGHRELMGALERVNDFWDLHGELEAVARAQRDVLGECRWWDEGVEQIARGLLQRPWRILDLLGHGGHSVMREG